MQTNLLRTTLLGLALAASLLANTPADGSQPAEYIEGSLKTIAPHAVGTLDYTDNKVLQFRSGKNLAKVPYAAITTVDVGPARVRNDEPVYKFWKWHERVGPWRSRYLTIGYQDENAERKNIILEMAEDAAAEALAAIEIKTLKRPADAYTSAVQDDYWWGNRYWKTNRNQEQWNKSQTGTVAPESKQSGQQE
jgi:hypothetical protein